MADQPWDQSPATVAEVEPPRGRGRGAWVAVIVLVAVLAAIATYVLTHRADPAEQDAAFLAQVKATMGSAPKDPARLVAAARRQCDASSESMKYLAGLIRDNGSTNVEKLTRIGISVYCPDRSAEFARDLAE